jgi:hypothetical protein
MNLVTLTLMFNKEGQFVEQKFELSCIFRLDQIHNFLHDEFDHTVLCNISQA